MPPQIVTLPLRFAPMDGRESRLTTFVVHHGGEGSPRDRDDAHGLAILRGYHAFHRGKGWAGISYHFGVLRSGTIVKLRPIGYVGAHSPPNTQAVGVILPGDYHGEVDPTPEQIASLRWLYNGGDGLIPKRLVLKGHRDRNDVGACPGDRLYAMLPRIAQGAPAPIRPKPVGGRDPNATPHRDLRITSPLTVGADVGMVQKAQRRLAKSYGIPMVDADEVFGRKTMGDRPSPGKAGTGIRGAGYYLGVADAHLTGPVSRHLQICLRDPRRRTRQEKARGKARYIRRRLQLRRTPRTERARLARRLLDHPRSRFGYVSPTGGSARVGLEQQARGQKAWVASPEAADTGRWVNIDVRILRQLNRLCDLSNRPVQITCVVNGDHSEDSGHYEGKSDDIGKPVEEDAVYESCRQTGVTAFDEDAVHFHNYV